MIDKNVSFLFQLYLTGRKIRGRFKHKNEDLMLRATFLLLLDGQKRTVSQLSELLSSKISAISEQVLGMEKDGYVRKTKEDDGRESYIQLTQKGKDKLSEMITDMKGHCILLREKLTDEEISLLLGVLKKIAE